MPIRTKTLILRLSVALAICTALNACKDRPQTPATLAMAQSSSSDTAKTDEHGRPTKGWVCDMACEGCKLFEGPGMCPVCHMDLRTYEDVPFNFFPQGSPLARSDEQTDVNVGAFVDPAGCPFDVDTLLAGPGGERISVAGVTDSGQVALGRMSTNADGAAELRTPRQIDSGAKAEIAVFTHPQLGEQIVSVLSQRSRSSGSAKPASETPLSAELTVRHDMQSVPATGGVIRLVMTAEPALSDNCRVAVVRKDLQYAEVAQRNASVSGSFDVLVVSPGEYTVLVWTEDPGTSKVKLLAQRITLGHRE